MNLLTHIRELARQAGSRQVKLPLSVWLVAAGGLTLLVFFWIAIVSLSQRITPRGIVIHHTGWIGGPVNAQSLDDFHERSGYGAFYWGRRYHIGYHYLIHPDGRIEAGRPERLRGAHAKHHNHYLGIALAGNFSPQHNPAGTRGLPEPTAAQVQALAALARKLKTKYEIPDREVLLHRQVHATECPGKNFPNRIFNRMLVRSGR